MMVLKVKLAPIQMTLDFRETGRTTKGFDPHVQTKSLPSLDVGQREVSMAMPTQHIGSSALLMVISDSVVA